MSTIRLSVQENLMSGIYTQDSRRTRDAMLTTPTREELDANARRVSKLTALSQGRVWRGDPAERLEEVCDLSAGAPIEDIQAAQNAFWAKRRGEPQECGWTGEPARTGDGRAPTNDMATLITRMNDANRAMWSNEAGAHPQPFSRVWGKG